MKQRYQVLKPKRLLYLAMLLACSFLLPRASSAQLVVNSNVTAAQLISSLTGAGLTVSNVNLNCPAGAFGTFSNGNTTNMGITNGILLTTGSANVAIGPNNSPSAGFCNGNSASDPQLVAIEPQATEDLCVLEFDIIPQCNQLTITFVFGSEEYPEFVNASFNDAFGFFISGPGPACQSGFYNNTNVATLPNGTPVSIDNVNATTNNAFYVNNSPGATIQYDAFTTVLTRNVQLCPCQTYHFKLAIADAGDCIYDSGVFVDFMSCSTALTLTSATTPAGCSGCTGTATVNLSGGTGPFTYSWAPGGQTTQTVNNLCAGTYTVSVTDQLSCSPPSTMAITVGSSGGTVTATGTPNNVTCNGQCTGSVTANPSGGTAPYTYAWSNGATTQTINGLCAGSYTVTITDANGCQGTQTYTITQPAVLTASTNTTPAVCGGNNGSATVTPGGGAGGYTYLWNPGGSTSATANGLAAGTYTVTVTDANGCTTQSTAIVGNSGGITASVSASTNVSCFGGANGSATASPAGGTAPYTYSWTGGGGNNQTANNLPAGSYTVTVTDANGCITTTSVTLTQPPQLTTSIGSTPALCNGGTGSANTTPGGGVGGYTYLWSPGGSTVSNPTGLAPGSYTVTVTDGNGCTTQANTTITQPTAINAPTSSTPAVCGQNNGSATVTPNGGTGAYTYLWTPGGQTTATANNIPTGNYSVTVTDANGCSVQSVVNVPNTGGPTVSMSAFTDVTCFGANDGTATSSIVGGANPIVYSWTSGGTGVTETGLGAGTYTVTATDANGCSSSATVTITEPPALTITNTAQTDVLCFGQATGDASITAGGGSPGYTYAWTSGGTGATESNLGAGNYTVTVTDLNGCQTTQAFTITEPPQLTLATAGFDASCNGACDGQVIVIPAGGVQPYTFAWNTGCTIPSCSNMCAGMYTVVVTDANGCATNNTATVNEPPAIVANTAVVDANCGQSDGSATVNANGGTAPYTYAWSSGGTAATEPNLPAGTYTVTITDAGSCTFTITATVGNINGVTAAPASSTNATCFGVCDGSASVNANGGTPPYVYSWTSGGNTASEAGLCAGTYTVTITDVPGCITTVSFTITEPGQIAAAAGAAASVCNGTAVTLGVNVNGGTAPYNISWMPNNLNGPNPSTTPTATTTYTVTVTDANGCSVTATQTINVNPVPASGLIADVTSGCAPLCVNFTDQSVIAPPDNVTGWSWDFGDSGGSSTQQNPSHCYTTPGVYTVILTVTSNNGCVSTTTMLNYISVSPVPVASFTFTPTDATVLNPLITFTDQSTGADTWAWSFGDLDSSTSSLQHPTFLYPEAGCHDVTLTVTNNAGCTDDTTGEVCIGPDWVIFVPNAFTPNGDGANDFFRPEGMGIDPENYEMWIFDRWGNMIWYTDDWYKSWNGKVLNGGSDEVAQIDTYVWKIKCKDILGYKHTYIGKVSIIK